MSFFNTPALPLKTTVCLTLSFFCFLISACDLPSLPPEPQKQVPQTTEPETLLLETPAAETTERNATFLFTCDQPNGCRFECRIDDQAYYACESPEVIQNLNFGNHQFYVRAIDEQNLIDTTPAAYSWTITKNGAGSRITSLEIAPFAFNKIEATFECDSQNCQYRCQLDDNEFFDCTSPLIIERVPSGTHQLKVQAIDLNNILVPDSDTKDFEIEDLWISVSARSAHTCALRTDGKLFCWGLNHLGQQGHEPGGVLSLPTVFNDANDWTTVKAGARHTCALKTDNSLWCWGANHDGNLATGDDTEVLAKCEADTTNHEVTCLSTEPLPIDSNKEWASLGIGWQHSCAIDTNEKLWCWGKNTSGQVGNGTLVNQSTPHQVSDASWLKVAAGSDATCGVQDNGTLHCWGQWHLTRTASTPTLINPDNDWVSVDAGGSDGQNSFCAIKEDASLWCFGDDIQGILGLGDAPTNTHLPTQVTNLDKVLAVSVGASHSCAVKENNELWCWGKNDLGQIGNNLVWGTENQTTPKLFNAERSWQKITTGLSHNCGITTEGYLFCWGKNYYGATGTSASAQLIPEWANLETTNSDTAWQSLAVAGDSACGIKGDDSLWCWGKNGQSPLGNHSNYHLQQPAQVGVFQWKKLSVGKHHACAIQGDDTLFCWGENNFHQINATNESAYASPTAVSEDLWEDISVGTNHACGIKDSGALFCWGNNQDGQCGQTLSQSVNTPSRLSLELSWAKVSSGSQHTCALATDDTLWCWGNNQGGQLGLPPSAFIQSNQPQQIIADNVTAFTDVAAGNLHTCALDEEQKLWCWGLHDKGQCGTNVIGEGTLSPSRVSGNHSWVSVAAGENITCAIKETGSLFCWGAIIFSESLPDHVSNIETPTLIDNAHYYTQVGVGDGFIMAIDNEYQRFGRGKNNFGQLGNNEAWRLEPTRIQVER